MTRICVCGDSVVSDELYLGFDCWVTKLRKLVNKKEENSVFNLGICGETTSDLLERIDIESKAREPGIILVKIGMNDSRYNNKTEDSVETSFNKFNENINEIIRICKKYTEKIIFVGNTPVDESKTMPTIWSKTEYFTNKSIKKYDDVIKSICKKNKIHFIEVFDKFIKLDYKKLLDEEDGLHPNSKGYEKIFEIIKSFLIKNRII